MSVGSLQYNYLFPKTFKFICKKELTSKRFVTFTLMLFQIGYL